MVYIDSETQVSAAVVEKSRQCFVRKRTATEYGDQTSLPR